MWAVGGWLVAALSFGAAAQPATFDVTVTATQVTTVSCAGSGQVDETLHAHIVSTAPGRATLRNGALTFAHDGDVPLTLTVSADYAGCGGRPVHDPQSCGSATTTMFPGGNLDYAAGKLLVSYDNNKRMFPADDSCSSGLTEVTQMPVALDLRTLLARRVTVVNGTYARDAQYTATAGTTTVHWDVRFGVRFARR